MIVMWFDNARTFRVFPAEDYTRLAAIAWLSPYRRLANAEPYKPAGSSELVAIYHTEDLTLPKGYAWMRDSTTLHGTRATSCTVEILGSSCRIAPWKQGLLDEDNARLAAVARRRNSR